MVNPVNDARNILDIIEEGLFGGDKPSYEDATEKQLKQYTYGNGTCDAGFGLPESGTCKICGAGIKGPCQYKDKK